MMSLPVIITFSFCGGFSLPSVMLSLIWDKSSDFWQWVDGWCHPNCKVFSFWHHEGWARNPPSRRIDFLGWSPIKVRSLILSWVRLYLYIQVIISSLLLGFLNVGSLYLANISWPKVDSCWLGCSVWCGQLGWQVIQHLPPSILASSQEPGYYHWWDRGHIFKNLWMRYAFWHVASFNAVEASFGRLTLTPLRHSRCHYGVFGFHAIITSFVVFWVSRVATSISESYDH